MDTEELYRENEALQESNEAMYAEIKKFNFGAFGLGWIWGLFNGAYKQVCIPCFVVFALYFLPFLRLLCNPLVLLIMHIYFGIKGSEWAWEERDWKDIHQFKAVQKKWAIAGIITIFVVPILWLAFVIPMVYKALSPRGGASGFNSGGSAIAFVITESDSLKNQPNGSAIAKELVNVMNESYTRRNKKSKCELFNKNTIKLSKYDSAAGKYVPVVLYTISKKGSCDLEQKNCYIISYDVKNGRAIFAEKLYYNDKGLTVVPKEENDKLKEAQNKQ